MKIYTGTGDRGKTGLFSGERVAKDCERIEAYGAVDELNSVLGALRAALPDRQPEVMAELQSLQGDLFRVGAWLATTPGSSAAASLEPFDPERIAALERAIDRIEATLPPLTGFILPGGGVGAGWAHLARTVCRRAERRAVRVAAGEPEPASSPLNNTVVYLNRLSDYLFVLARQLNRNEGVAETPWRR
jgi:cob(I)alamin adenosyltransferase